MNNEAQELGNATHCTIRCCIRMMRVIEPDTDATEGYRRAPGTPFMNSPRHPAHLRTHLAATSQPIAPRTKEGRRKTAHKPTAMQGAFTQAWVMILFRRHDNEKMYGETKEHIFGRCAPFATLYCTSSDCHKGHLHQDRIPTTRNSFDSSVLLNARFPGSCPDPS